MEAQVEALAPGFRDRVLGRARVDAAASSRRRTRTSSAARSTAAPRSCTSSSSSGRCPALGRARDAGARPVPGVGVRAPGRRRARRVRRQRRARGASARAAAALTPRFPRRHDPAGDLAQPRAAQHDVVAVLQEAARRAVGSSIGSPRSSTARSASRAHRAPGRRSCRSPRGRRCAARAVNRQVGDHLRRGPVQVARVVRATTAPLSSISSPGRAPRALAQVGQRSGLLRRRRYAEPLERGQRRHPGADRGCERLGQERPSGWYSHACRSRALQSLTAHAEHVSSASVTATGSPSGSACRPRSRARARCRAARWGRNAARLPGLAACRSGGGSACR